ncbi:MAG: hypothetical protein K2X43_09955 [Hyphomonadaceae bacterium]|nr:hypothetical protein [Hyphomonadaceae bacterium]
MTDAEDKLAEIDRQIAEAVAEREDLIRRIPDLPPGSAEKAEAVRHRDALNEVLVTLRGLRHALDAVRGS